LDFPAPPSVLDVSVRTLGVFPHPSPRGTEVHRIDPRDLGVVFRALATPLDRRAGTEVPAGPPLLALLAVRPSAGCLLLRPLPVRRPKPIHLRVGVSTPRLSFRPRGFAPPRRLSPQQARGFVAPRCRPWGSSRFGGRVSERGRRIGTTGTTRASSRRGHDPSKGSPRQQPCRITAAVASAPLAPRPGDSILSVPVARSVRVGSRLARAKRA